MAGAMIPQVLLPHRSARNLTMRKRLILFGFCVVASLLMATVQAAPVLMPQPAKLQPGSGVLQLPNTIEVAVEGPDSAAVRQALQLLRQFQPRLAVQTAPTTSAQLQIRYREAIPLPSPDDDESYQLHIDADQIRLDAHSSTGVLYGLMTLSQLVSCDSKSNGCQLPQLQISDKPRFRWRGLLLDNARRFIPLADIRRTLDGMAAAKLNVLHWHLTDDQGWRIESQAYPKLHQLASQGQFYSQQQVRELVTYAVARGIRIVPELDVPGHASAIGMAYPELLAWPDAMLDKNGVQPLPPERRFGVFAPVLDVSKAESWQFISALVAEWRQLFPDPYLHIGGDEVKADHWLANSKIQQLMQQQQCKCLTILVSL